jgi:hypothetical protein
MGFGQAFFIGRELPPYYILATEAISKARYSIFTVNTSTGKVSSVQNIPQESYTDNTQEDAKFCFSEAGGIIYIVEDDGMIIYNVKLVNNKITYTLTLAKRGFPKAVQLLRGDDKYDECSIVSPTEMVYHGVDASDKAKKIRLFKVDSNGGMVWGNAPNNPLPAGKTITSLVSVFPNGTSIFGGNGYYMVVDKNGNGVARTKVDNGKFGTFAVGADGDAVSYSGDHFAPQDSLVPTQLHPEPIIHEEYRKIIAFRIKETAKGGKVFDMDGRRNTAIPVDWEFYDYDDRVFFTDALFTLSREKQYPYNKFIEVSAISTQKEDFGIIG